MSDDVLTRVHWQRDHTQAADLHPIGYATWGALVAFGIAITAIESSHATGRIWGVLLAINIALWVHMILFVLLLIRQSQLGFREWTTETPVVPETGRALRIMAADLENPRNITVAKYALNDRQMTALAQAIYRAGWRLRRDDVRRASVLPSADMERWSDVVVPEFARANLIDDAGNVTRRGRALFEPYLAPAPPPFVPTINPPPVRRLSDDDGEDDMSRWGGGS